MIFNFSNQIFCLIFFKEVGKSRELSGKVLFLGEGGGGCGVSIYIYLTRYLVEVQLLHPNCGILLYQFNSL